VRVWDGEGRLLHRLEGHQGRVWSVAFAAEGGRLASASDDGTVRVWNVESGKLLLTIYHLPNGAWLSLDPDGRYRGNEPGIEYLCYADGLASYPARLFPEREWK